MLVTQRKLKLESFVHTKKKENIKIKREIQFKIIGQYLSKEDLLNLLQLICRFIFSFK